MLSQATEMVRLDRRSSGHPKDFLSVLDEVVHLAARNWRLTPREQAVIRALLEGRSNRAISAELHCMLRTVELHVTNILAKTTTESRLALVSACWERWIAERMDP